jgi:hypothetical protein
MSGLEQPTTCIPYPSAAMRATARPMPPHPTIASFIPWSSTPGAGSHTCRVMFADVESSGRAAAATSSIVCSATDWLSTPGVLLQSRPAAVALRLSMLSWPTPNRAMTPPCGSAS